MIAVKGAATKTSTRTAVATCWRIEPMRPRAASAERREERDGDADADDLDRDLRQLEGVVVGGQAAFRQSRGEDRADKEVDLSRRQAEHPRPHQPATRRTPGCPRPIVRS